MDKNLRISLVQADLHWEDVDQNLQMFTEKLNSEELAGTDLVILPEMFNTGFSMKSELFAEEMEGKTMAWLREMAKAKNCVVTGSLIIKDKGACYNRLIWMQPDGEFFWYDKRHLFRMAKEHEHFNAGSERVILKIKDWRICPLICYDLRFPVWSANQDNYDLLIYIANWPEKRSHAWRSLLVARAIENLSYVAGLNRVGCDGNEIEYSGDSAVIDYRGEYMATSIPLNEEILTMELDYQGLLDFRKSFPVFLDADDFTLAD